MKSGWCIRTLYFASMRIVTLNANGIRSAARKGLFDWLPKQDADVRLRAGNQGAGRPSLATHISGRRAITGYYFDASKKGYSGVADLQPGQAAGDRPATVRATFDAEGRYMRRGSRIPVGGFGLPSIGLLRRQERQRAKFRFMAQFMPYLRSLERKRRNFILCGDWNIAHRQIDLRNWRGNQKNSGFLPEERLARRALRRGWLRRCVSRAQFGARPLHLVVESRTGLGEERGLADRLPGPEPEPGTAERPRGRHPQGAGLRFSDHAPLTIDYDL